ncbi:hypothetical protein HYS50_02815 [Candidatus Woesearchaeota archaeon]|nr:hypothetical protein [Candidatus Woesearchaeota archaeon]
MKQITAVLLMLLVIGIQPAFALKDLSNEEISRGKYITPVTAAVAVADPNDIPDKYKEGEQLKIDDKSYYQDIIKQREKNKDRLEKEAIVFEVGESQNFFIRSNGREEQVQVTLTGIHEKSRESLFSIAKEPSDVIDVKPKEKEKKKANYYCANFLIQTGSIHPPQPEAEPAAPEQAVPSIVTPPSPPSAQPSLEKEVVIGEGGVIPIGKLPPIPVKEDMPSIYYTNQELCLTPKDIGFIIEVYTIDVEKQRVKFALNAEEMSTGVDVIAMAQEDERVLAAQVKRTRTSIPAISPEKGERVKTTEEKKEERKGCRVNGESIEIGTRFIEEQDEKGRAMYCTPLGEIMPQKEAGEEAEDEYECISGKVADGRCNNPLTILQRILSLFGLY